jgi:hypothetical protein
MTNTPKTMTEIRDAEALKQVQHRCGSSCLSLAVQSFKQGFDCRDKLDHEALKALIDQIETVKCTGPNQKEVLKKLYEIADKIRELRGMDE